MNLIGANSAQVVLKATARGALVAIVAYSYLPAAAHAVTTNWNISSSGSFTTAANWDNGVPDSDDTAVFNRGFVAYEVRFPSGSVFNPPNYLINYLRVHTNEVSFVAIDSPFAPIPPSVSVINPDVSIVFGQDAGDVAIVNMTLSGLSGANASIGRAPGAEGTLNVGGTFSMSGSLDVGDLGKGTMNVAAGGSVSSLNGSISNGFDAIGAVTVSGANSQWISDQLIVGQQGSGTLNITAGGRVENRVSTVGVATGSTGAVAVSGANSQWINSGELNVGLFSVGTLDITAGGSVSSRKGFIGKNVAIGTVTVSGGNSTWTIAERLSIGGGGGRGTLDIQLGALVSVAQDIVVFPDSRVLLQGGTLKMQAIDFLPDGGLGRFLWSAGMLQVETFDLSLVHPAGGVLAPGQSVGSTTINGHYTQQAGAELEIEIGGTTPGAQFDRVTVAGSASLAGTLDLSLINGFVPELDDSFEILTAAVGVTGTFASVVQPAGMPAGLLFDAVYSPTFVRLVVVSAPSFTADFDEDGDVDGDDLVQWRGNFGANGLSDADDDGDSDGTDFLAWQQQFGSAPLATAASAVVPEPASVVLLIVAAAALCARQSRAA